MGITRWGSAIAGVLLWNCAGVAMATQVSGFFGGDTGGGGFVQVSFTCTLAGTTCTGIANISGREPECSNSYSDSGSITVTGLALGAAGPIQGNVSVVHTPTNSAPNAIGVCAYVPTMPKTSTLSYRGQWDGVGRGSFDLEGLNEEGKIFRWTGTFTADVPAAAAVFPMTVTGSIDATTANIRADIQFRPQDIGTNASVYVFAWAPVALVRAAAAPSEIPGVMAKGAKADAAACVLAQLNMSGQLQQVSASGMQAYISGVLSSQGQAITVLNGVPTVQIAGATFYVGYGATSSAMLNNGVNRSVVTAPAATTCQPQPPQTGWWWNPSEGGRGFSLEVRGNTMFFASFLYDVSGRSTWLAASGPTSLDGSLFTGRLYGFSGGQTLDGPWQARGPAQDNGAATLAFNDATHGTLVWPGGSIPIERFDFVANGHAAPAQANVPETGWWWNPQEDGRGFFLEWQAGSAFIAGYMYDATGNPVWYLTQATTPDARAFQGTWTQYANGQTLAGTYRAAIQSNANVAPVAITFQGADSAIMTLPGGRTTSITRFRF